MATSAKGAVERNGHGGAEGQSEPGTCGDSASDLIEDNRGHCGSSRDATSAVEYRKGQATQRCSCCEQVVKKQLSEWRHACAKCGYTTTRDRNVVQVRLCYALEGECWPGAGHRVQAPKTPQTCIAGLRELFISSDDKPRVVFQNALLP